MLIYPLNIFSIVIFLIFNLLKARAKSRTFNKVMGDVGVVAREKVEALVRIDEEKPT